MSKFELWFPVVIYSEENVLPQEEVNKLKEYCLSLESTVPTGGGDWYGGTFNSHGTYDLRHDKNFDVMLTTVTNRVNEYAKAHNCQADYTAYGSWFNISRENNFQEFHTHNGNIISAVYYVAAPEGSGKIVFEDPKEPDMNQMKSIMEKNPMSFTRIGYPAQENSLIIFRSYLRHCVTPGTNTEPRISIAMNFR